MVELEMTPVDASVFLSEAGLGRRIVDLEPKELFLLAGRFGGLGVLSAKRRSKDDGCFDGRKRSYDPDDFAGEFVGEGALAAIPGPRLSTATAITACSAMKIMRKEMIRVLHEEHGFSDLFVRFLLTRSIWIQTDLVDHLFNSIEKRLAKILLLMAEFGKPGRQETLIPRISQETLADMIGTTRSRVSFFMNRFRKMGSIDYGSRIRVHKSLLNVILLDRILDA